MMHVNNHDKKESKAATASQNKLSVERGILLLCVLCWGKVCSVNAGRSNSA